VVALEEMPFGAGRIDRFVSAELILVLVAGTIGGDTGRLLQTDISTSSWSDKYIRFGIRRAPVELQQLRRVLVEQLQRLQRWLQR